MTDFEYDVLCKRRIARSAFAKKGGSKSKSCKLPHEYLSKKEIAKMNGAVKNWNLNAPMSWSCFKEMPYDLQLEYVLKLRSEYNVNGGALAKMFGINQSTVNNYFAYGNPSLRDEGRRRQMNDEQAAAWEKFCKGDPAKKPEPVYTAEPEVKHINHLTFYTEEQETDAQEDEAPVLRAHDFRPVSIPEYPAWIEEAEAEHTAAMPTFSRVKLNLSGTPQELLLGLDGLLGLMPYDGKLSMYLVINPAGESDEV